MSHLLSCVSLPCWASPLCISTQELLSSRLKTAGKALARERPRPKPHSRIRRFDAWSRVQRARGPGEQPPAPTEAPPSRRRTPRASKTPKHRNSDREDGETRRRGLGAAPVSRAKRRCTRLPGRRGAVAASGAVGLKRRQIYAFFTFSQSASNFARPSAVSGCLTQFFKAPKGTVAMSAPMSAAAVTWYGLRMEAAMISHSWPKS